MEICSELQLEPHPVSGEIELFGDDEDGEAGKPVYRRLDSETLQARCDIREHNIGVVWVWCENDSGTVGLPGDADSAAPQHGWRVAEVLPLEEDDEDLTASRSGWHNSMGEAQAAFEATQSSRNLSPPASRKASYAAAGPSVRNATLGAVSNMSGDDDDYWASYDRTPSRTPAESPAPPTASNAAYGNTSSVYNPSRERQPSTQLEADYYARYGSVQPAMDGHDPDEEEGAAAFESTLHHQDQERSEPPPNLGDINRPNDQYQFPQSEPMSFPMHGNHDNDDEEPPITTAAQGLRRVHSPTPSRPSSSSSGRKSPIDTLEASASTTSAAEMGVKQHICTELKSLFRLARATGIERSEFERVVRTELDVLSIMDM